jgi:hypothetical protein
MALLVGIVLTASGADAGDHLSAGAQLFRDGRHAEALVEFRVAERMGAAEARPYAAAALVKLGRHEEAVEAFGAGGVTGGDALLEYYRAMACYGARLYLCADRALAAVGERSGPRIAQQAARLRAEIAAALRQEPSTASVDFYLSRCAGLHREGRAALAAAFCTEALELTARRKDRYRRDEASALLAKLAPSAEARP